MSKTTASGRNAPVRKDAPKRGWTPGGGVN